MAAFEQHVNIAVLATGVAIVPLHASGLLEIHSALIALVLGLLGGILPDLDSDTSKPIQSAFKILSIFLPLLVMISITKELSIVEMLAIWAILSLLLHLVLFKLFLSLTRHRGIFHTIPMGIIFGQFTILFFVFVLKIDIALSSIYGFFVFFGFIIHLSLDEIYSVNALGLSIKHSFGSALKLYDKKNIFGTIFLYILLGFNLYFIPFDQDMIMRITKALSEVHFL